MRDLKIGLKQATVFLIFHLIGFTGWSQEATYKVSNELIKTYPFSDPNPVPPVAVNNDISRFYPYFTYEGYAVKDTMKDWKVVELENKFLKVKILPEVGGKVWGAIEKSTGFDFIYLNHVLKFRAIGIRGPWTSGGIEHNFGLDIGHAPWTASPVDYIVQKNPDGSVSCTVGGLDLASRTQWRVEIRLAKDAASFETRSLWYNATPYHLSYLSWENAGFKADDDLEFYFPGDHYLGHDGSAHSWPSDEKGRLLSLYKNNNFGSSKSYHTIGSYRNFYGGYWHNKNIGFGHWAPYSDAPGKKVWIWSLARDGAIWKDLLTDTDGQYIEAQSGVTFNQADFVSGLHSPFKQLSLRPGYSETKTESWFPVMNTSGISDASREGVLNVIKENDSLQIIISPTQKIDDSLYIRTGSNTVSVQMLHLQPLQVYHKKIKLAQNSDSQISVQLGVDKLSYEIGKTETGIKRPLVFPRDLDSSDAERFFLLAEDENSMRKFDDAFRDYSQCISKDPYHLRALSRVAELYCRSYQYEKALAVAQRALAINTYDPDANYIYGVVQRRMGKSEAALEAFSVAVRSMEYRSEAYSQLAGIKMQQKNFGDAIDYALRALDYNKYNLSAQALLVSCYRRIGNSDQALNRADQLLNIDPLNHYARFEKYLLDSSASSLSIFKTSITNEFPQESYLEIAASYLDAGLEKEAVKVLETAPRNAMSCYWLAFLKRNLSPEESISLLQEADRMSPAFVFPSRYEEIPVLQWAADNIHSWKPRYYLGLLYWSNQRKDKTEELFSQCGDEPGFAPFYIARAVLHFQDSVKKTSVLEDLNRAVRYEPLGWRNWHYLNLFYLNNKDYFHAVQVSRKAIKNFPENPVIKIGYAKALLYFGKYNECIAVLNKTLILPQESAREAHDLYEVANLSEAVEQIKNKNFNPALKYIHESEKWPEHLGTGEPYDPDSRLQNYLALYCNEQLKKKGEADQARNSIITYTGQHWPAASHPANNYVGILMLKKEGKEAAGTLLMDGWIKQLDSLQRWRISSALSSAPLQWITADFYNKSSEEKDNLEKQCYLNDADFKMRIFLTARKMISGK